MTKYYHMIIEVDYDWREISLSYDEIEAFIKLAEESEEV